MSTKSNGRKRARAPDYHLVAAKSATALINEARATFKSTYKGPAACAEGFEVVEIESLGEFVDDELGKLVVGLWGYANLNPTE